MSELVPPHNRSHWVSPSIPKRMKIIRKREIKKHLCSSDPSCNPCGHSFVFCTAPGQFETLFFYSAASLLRLNVQDAEITEAHRDPTWDLSRLHFPGSAEDEKGATSALREAKSTSAGSPAGPGAGLLQVGKGCSPSPASVPKAHTTLCSALSDARLPDPQRLDFK